MPEIRGEARADKRGKRMSKDKRKSHRKETVFHLIPDLFYAGSAAELAGPTAVNVYNEFKAGGMAAAGPALNWSIHNELLPDAVPAAELAIVGIVVQKVAKYLGLNKIGTKRIKVF